MLMVLTAALLQLLTVALISVLIFLSQTIRKLICNGLIFNSISFIIFLILLILERNIWLQTIDIFAFYAFTPLFFIGGWLIRSYKLTFFSIFMFSLHLSGIIALFLSSSAQIAYYIIFAGFATIHTAQYILILKTSNISLRNRKDRYFFILEHIIRFILCLTYIIMADNLYFFIYLNICYIIDLVLDKYNMYKIYYVFVTLTTPIIPLIVARIDSLWLGIPFLAIVFIFFIISQYRYLPACFLNENDILILDGGKYQFQYIFATLFEKSNDDDVILSQIILAGGTYKVKYFSKTCMDKYERDTLTFEDNIDLDDFIIGNSNKYVKKIYLPQIELIEREPKRFCSFNSQYKDELFHPVIHFIRCFPNLKLIETPVNKIVNLGGAYYSTNPFVLLFVSQHKKCLFIREGVKSVYEKATLFKRKGKSNYHIWMNNNILDDDSNECVLTVITFPASIETIGKKAFYNCHKLKAITFKEPSKLKIIDDYAFVGTEIRKLTIPSSVKSIGIQAFAKNYSLCEITFNEGSNLKIGPRAFCMAIISRIEIPTTWTTIHAESFAEMSNLKYVIFKIPSQITTIESKAFAYSKFKELKLPPSVRTVEFSAFYQNENINIYKIR